MQEMLRSAKEWVPAEEFLIALSPKGAEQKWEPIIQKILDGKNVRIFEGTDQKNQVSRVRHNLFSQARGEWLLNCDDDDVIIGSYDLASIPDGVGLVHSDIVAFCTTEAGWRRPFDTFLRKAQRIDALVDANWFRGSYYGYRREAWLQASEHLDTSTIEFEDWRTAYHILRLGWKDHYVHEVLQVQRVRDYVSEAAAQRGTGRTWNTVFAAMEKTYGASR